MENTLNNQNAGQNTNSNGSALSLSMVGLVADPKSLVVRNQDPIPLSLMMTDMSSQTTTKTNLVKASNSLIVKNAHPEICLVSEAAITAGICWFGFQLTRLSQPDKQINVR